MITFLTPTVIKIAINNTNLNLDVDVTPSNQHVFVDVDLLKHDTLVLQPIGSGNNGASQTVTFNGINVQDGDRLFVTTRVTSLSPNPINVTVDHTFTPPANIASIEGSTTLPTPAQPPATIQPAKLEKFYAQFNIKT